MPKNGNFGSGLGKHQSKRCGLRFQNQGEANPATREQVGNAANRCLGHRHVHACPRNASGVSGARNWGCVGGVNSLEATAGSYNGNCTRARKCSLVQVEDDVEAGGSGGGVFGTIRGNDLGSESLKKRGELVVGGNETSSRDQHICCAGICPQKHLRMGHIHQPSRLTISADGEAEGIRGSLL